MKKLATGAGLFFTRAVQVINCMRYPAGWPTLPFTLLPCYVLVHPNIHCVVLLKYNATNYHIKHIVL